MEQSRGLLADEVDTATVVDVVDVVPGDALCPVFLLQGEKKKKRVTTLICGSVVSVCERGVNYITESNAFIKN